MLCSSHSCRRLVFLIAISSIYFKLGSQMNFKSLLFYFAVWFHVQFPFPLASQCFLTSKITGITCWKRICYHLDKSYLLSKWINDILWICFLCKQSANVKKNSLLDQPYERPQYSNIHTNTGHASHQTIGTHKQSPAMLVINKQNRRVK